MASILKTLSVMIMVALAAAVLTGPAFQIEAHAATPSERVADGAEAASEALDSEPESPTSLQTFAARMLDRLNHAAEQLREAGDRTARWLKGSFASAPAQLDDIWTEALGKFQRLQTHAGDSYTSLERRMMRGIEQFQSWLAGNRTRPPANSKGRLPEPDADDTAPIEV